MRVGLSPAAKISTSEAASGAASAERMGGDVTNPGRAGRLGGLTVARLHSTPDDPTDHQAEHD